MPVQPREPIHSLAASFGSAAAIGSTMRPMAADAALVLVLVPAHGAHPLRLPLVKRITTIGSDYWPSTPEGRLLCLLLSVYGLAVFGYVTAALASFFIGRDIQEASGPVTDGPTLADLHGEIRRLREQLKDAGIAR